jgi:hypothetical protein
LAKKAQKLSIMSRTTRHKPLPRLPWTRTGELSAPFEKRLDPQSGRHYFVDHRSHTTTWVDPRDAKIKPLDFDQCYDSELPFGWETAVDPDVGLYYIDHNTWTTQLEDPRLGIVRRSSSSSLPRPVDFRARAPKRSSRQVQNRLVAAQVELVRLQSEGNSSDPLIESQIIAAMKRVSDLRAELSTMRSASSRNSEPLASHTSSRPTSRASQAQSTAQSVTSGVSAYDLDRLYQSNDRDLQLLSEREFLKRSLLELELKSKQEKDVADLRMEMLRLQLDNQRGQTQSRTDDVLNETIAKLETQAQQTDASFRV